MICQLFEFSNNVIYPPNIIKVKESNVIDNIRIPIIFFIYVHLGSYSRYIVLFISTKLPQDCILWCSFIDHVIQSLGSSVIKNTIFLSSINLIRVPKGLSELHKAVS